MDLIDKRDEVLRIFLEYGITENTENDLTKTDLAECAEQIVKKLIIGGVVKSLKGKHTQTFDEFMTGICKNRGITLINNYTKETVGFDTLIEKWKATNT